MIDMENGKKIVVPFIGGSVHFLPKGNFVAKDGRVVEMIDRVRIFTDSSKGPAEVPKEAFNEVLAAVERREDIRQFLGLDV